jgi:hypothetical protein
LLSKNEFFYSFKGYIDFSEVHSVLQQLGIKIQRFELTKILEKNDKNKDAQLTKEQFEDVRKKRFFFKYYTKFFYSFMYKYVLKKIQVVHGIKVLNQQLEVLIDLLQKPMIPNQLLNNNKVHQVHIIVS